MPRLAHPCVKHIASITWHCCQQVKLLLMSAILALLEEAYQGDEKNPTSPLDESSPPLNISSSVAGWCCSPGLEHHLTLFLTTAFLLGKDLLSSPGTSQKVVRGGREVRESAALLIMRKAEAG